MDTTRRLLVVVAAVGLCGGQGPAAQDDAAAPPIILHDMTGLRALDLADDAARCRLWDACHLTAALQGLANRDAPRLYVRFIAKWDDFWLAWLRRPGHWLDGRAVRRIDTIEELCEHFAGFYRGVVLYAAHPRPLSNLASTIAGAEDLLPVRRDERPGSLYRRLVLEGLRLPVVVDLTAQEFPCRTGSVKCDPYLWAVDRYLAPGRSAPDYLAYTIDTWWLEDPFRGNHENHTLTNHDFFIARRAFFFDLAPWDDETPNDDRTQALGTDAATLKTILRAAYDRIEGKGIIHAGGFVPWAWKYCDHVPGASKHGAVASEWRYAEILSCYNAMMDADALGPCAMANASFYTHYPLAARYPQPPSPDDDALRAAGFLCADGLVEPGAYVCFYVGDYDSAAWLYREFPRCWDDPARGTVPLGWALNPNLERRCPVALAYARETMTPADVFTAGDSGAGYLNPGGLTPPRAHSGLPSGLAAWEAFCRPFYARWDLRVTGFIIDGNSPPMHADTWAAYTRFSPGGIGGQKMPPQGLRNGLPFIRVTDAPGSALEAARQFSAMIVPERRSFHYVRTILKTASWHAEFARLLARMQPHARVVDPHAFFALLARYERDKTRYPVPRWAKETVAWRAGEEDGLRFIPFVDGPIAVEEAGGRRAVVSRAAGRPVYMYVGVHDGFPRGVPEDLSAEVTYLDTPGGRFCIHYNAVESAYASSHWVALDGSNTWKTVRVLLRGAQLSKQQNAAADLRFCNAGGLLVIHAVTLARAEP